MKRVTAKDMNSLKTAFMNLAIYILDGGFNDAPPATIEQMRERMPLPDKRAHSDGVNRSACSQCGRGNVFLRLDMRKGWLCTLCARETDIERGLTTPPQWYETEMGHLCGTTCKRKVGEGCDTCRTSGKGRKSSINKGGRPHGSLSVEPRIMGAAVDMYFDGLSYRRVAENVGEYFDEPTNPTTVYRWVTRLSLKAKDMIEDTGTLAHTGDEWVADEMQVTVAGRKYWLFNVMDSDSRYVLAAYLSPERTARAAATTLALARERSANAPKTIKTDGLRSYREAVKTAFPTHPVKHVVSQGIRAEINNNLSERLQGTFRDRDKTLRAMKGQETGQAYINGLVINYNNFRPHEGLDGRTPAKAADAELPVSSWLETAERVEIR